MVDYEFYVNYYLGSLIPQKGFGGCAARAKEALDRFKSCYQVVSSGPEAEKLAICAMAEAIYAARKNRGNVASATVGSVSVRYEDSAGTNKALWRELYAQASIYLDIYRGACVC